jgi:hypothetical protein
VLRIYHNLPPLERMQVQQAITGTQAASAPLQPGEALTRYDTVEVTGELVTDRPSEETQIRQK